MLVLVRKPGEIIYCDGPCIIHVLGRNNTKLGIEAPSGTNIVRGELYDEPADNSHAEKKEQTGNAIQSI